MQFALASLISAVYSAIMYFLWYSSLYELYVTLSLGQPATFTQSVLSLSTSRRNRSTPAARCYAICQSWVEAGCSVERLSLSFSLPRIIPR